MRHPAGREFTVADGACRRVWYGSEVEGLNQAGDWTAFINDELEPEELERLGRKLKNSTDDGQPRVDHIFLTERFSDWEWLRSALIPLAQSSAVPITLARHTGNVQHALDMRAAGELRGVNLMVRLNVEAPWVHQLRVGDQVSAGVSYMLTTWRYEDGAETRPHQYEGDKP
jgi:hypothetical protein